MKRLLCLLLILCLPVPALAETVAERIGAPESWQGEFVTNTGKSPIRVNMTVEVPEVDSIPIWQVKPHAVTVEDAVFVADELLGESNWQQEDAEDGPRWIEQVVGQPPLWTAYDCDLSWNRDDHHGFVSASKIYLENMGDWLWHNMLHCSADQEDDFRIDSLEDAIVIADEIVSRVAPDMVYNGASPLDNLHARDYPYPHCDLYYAREVGGIPVTYSSEEGARNAREEFNPVLPREQLWFCMDSERISFQWHYPLDVTGMVAEDCELLPFDQIMDVFGTIAPLTLLPFEGEGGVSLTSDRVVLGYMCLQERNNPRAYRLVPVWDFFGVRTLGRERQDDAQYSWLTINAIDGTVIDRVLGY